MLLTKDNLVTLMSGLKQSIGTKVTSITPLSTNNEYPTAKAVKDYVDTSISQSISSLIVTDEEEF